MHVNAPNRQPDGSVGLVTFMNYGGQVSYKKWMELFIGISPNRDYTLYMGVLSSSVDLYWRISEQEFK